MFVSAHSRRIQFRKCSPENLQCVRSASAPRCQTEMRADKNHSTNAQGPSPTCREGGGRGGVCPRLTSQSFIRNHNVPHSVPNKICHVPNKNCNTFYFVLLENCHTPSQAQGLRHAPRPRPPRDPHLSPKPLEIVM